MLWTKCATFQFESIFQIQRIRLDVNGWPWEMMWREWAVPQSCQSLRIIYRIELVQRFSPPTKTKGRIRRRDLHNICTTNIFWRRSWWITADILQRRLWFKKLHGIIWKRPILLIRYCVIEHFTFLIPKRLLAAEIAAPDLHRLGMHEIWLHLFCGIPRLRRFIFYIHLRPDVLLVLNV